MAEVNELVNFESDYVKPLSLSLSILLEAAGPRIREPGRFRCKLVDWLDDLVESSWSVSRAQCRCRHLCDGLELRKLAIILARSAGGAS